MITEALKRLRPGSPFVCIEESYDGIDWRDPNTTQPTREEVEAEVALMQADYAAKQYQRDRAAAYPSIAEQLDMRYWDEINGTTTWADAIAAVKAQYPKPEGV